MSFFLTLGSVPESEASIFIASVSWLSAKDAANDVQTMVKLYDLTIRTLKSMSTIFDEGFQDLWRVWIR